MFEDGRDGVAGRAPGAGVVGGVGVAWSEVGDVGDLLAGRDADLVAVLEAGAPAAVALVAGLRRGGAELLEEGVHGSGCAGGGGRGGFGGAGGGCEGGVGALSGHGGFDAAAVVFCGDVLLFGFLGGKSVCWFGDVGWLVDTYSPLSYEDSQLREEIPPSVVVLGVLTVKGHDVVVCAGHLL